MKMKLAALVAVVVLLIPTVSQAAPREWFQTIRDETDSFSFTSTSTPNYPSTFWQLYASRPDSVDPGFLQIDWDSGFTMIGSSLGLNGIPQARIASLVSDLASINTSLSNKSNNGHTHSTGDISGLVPLIDSRVATGSPMTFGTTTRSLNTAFKISSSRAVFSTYTVDIATTLTLTGGATGTVTLEYADDSAFTTNVKTVQSAVNGNTGTLTIGLALTQTGTATVTGIIPANKWVRISTANTAGTPTFTYRTQQEVVFPMT